MKHWIAGSGQWRSPNPSYDPAAAPRTQGWVKQFGVNWRWSPNRQHLIGEIVGIAADGETVVSADMYAFYNPVTERVVQIQIARNGIYSIAEDPVRDVASSYGEAEVSDSLEFWKTGEIRVSRHSNVFVDADTQLSDVFARGDDGEWERRQQWRWTRVAER